MHIRSRQLMVLGLVGVFFVQTAFVYTDGEGRRTPPLNELASRGQDLWHDNNCQSCHQLYGFGGFLGPDLTNAIGHLTPARLESILTAGSKSMPAFGLPPADRDAVAAFLEAVDRTGFAQPKLAPPLAARDRLTQLVEISSAPDALSEVERAGGAIVYEQGCIDCHLPNGLSAFRAPDLTRAFVDSSPERVDTVLSDGIPEKGMPRLDLAPKERASVLAFLRVLERHGDPIRSGFESSEQRTGGSFPLPAWFEYPRQ